jgi:hypothetical protein
MYKISIVLLLFLLPALSQAQNNGYDTLFSVRQESIPPNDSGGRWLPSALDITSISAYPQHVQIYTLGIVLDYGHYDRDSIWKLPDSAYYIADSIFIYSFQTVKSNNPRKYIDSNYPNTQVALDFLLPAHGTIRVPIGVRAITQKGIPGDTVSHFMQIISYSDSSGKTRESGYNLNLRCITMYSGQFGAWQSFIPPNDSGGRWLLSEVVVKSLAGYNSILDIIVTDGKYKLGDSAFYLADSIDFNDNGYQRVSSNPRKYIDSVEHYRNSFLYYTLKPHQTMHLPVWIWNANDHAGDTVNISTLYIAGVAEVAGNKLNSAIRLPIQCITACAAPGISYDGSTLDNKDHAAILGTTPTYTYFDPTCKNCTFGSTTMATYRIVGESSDRFDIPQQTTFYPGIGNGVDPRLSQLIFHGAPKSPVHDSLIAIYTTCWGSISTRTPITAYSTYADEYQIRQLPFNFKAPFLGRVTGNAALVLNTSDFPITIRDLHAVSSYDGMDFEVSGPAMIAAHDSGYVNVALKDKNLYLDTIGTNRSATITGIIAPYQQALEFKDSTFSVSVSGSIDVYSPLYFSWIPVLKHGVHPAGIIFTSSVSSLSGPGTFLTVYGNSDSTTEYFGMPYYDDPHFTFSIGDYIGTGTVALPGNVKPDTGLFPKGIQVLTTFTGDSYHNYFTQMHWPRATDTVTIDVVAIGKNAPPLDKVTYSSETRSISLWPNPAYSILHIRCEDPTANFWITDMLGRKIRTGKGTETSIDISDLPTGLYVLSFSKLVESIKFQVLR